MKKEVIDAISNTYQFVKWMEPNSTVAKGWFLLEISPLPPQGDLMAVISDIHYGCDVGVSYSNGNVYHNPDCAREKHSLPTELDRLMRKVNKSIRPKTFRVAIFPDFNGVLFGQPLAMVFDPLINYDKFPDHPHLNTGNADIPDTLCYTDDISGLGSNSFERINEAIRLVAIWLLRHMIWEKTRLYVTPGEWVGPSAQSTILSYDYLRVIDPNGYCRCGKQVDYKNCHMPHDLKSIPLPFMAKPSDYENIRLANKNKHNAFAQIFTNETNVLNRLQF